MLLAVLALCASATNGASVTLASGARVPLPDAGMPYDCVLIIPHFFE